MSCCGGEEEFDEMERLFHRFQAKINEMREEILKFEMNPIDRLHDLVENNFNLARDRLLDKAKRDQQIRLGKLDPQNSAEFISSQLNLEKCLTKVVADKSIENNNFMKYKVSILYLNLFQLTISSDRENFTFNEKSI